MDPSERTTPPGVSRLTTDWFAAALDIDDDLLLDESPFVGLAVLRDSRPPHRRVLDLHGGIVATAELLSAGIDQMVIRFLLGRKHLVRLRKGWYGSPDLPNDAARAWRIGGPLACVSALVHHGVLNKAELPAEDGLHVAVRQNTSRRPASLTIATYPLEDPAGSAPPTLHWSTRDFRSGDRTAVSIRTALEHARHCRPREQHRTSA